MLTPLTEAELRHWLKRERDPKLIANISAALEGRGTWSHWVDERLHPPRCPDPSAHI